MSKFKIIISYTDYSDAELDAIVNSGIKGTTGNANFTFTKNELTDTTTAYNAFHTALSAIATGNKATITAKDAARKTLEDKLGILCPSINLQANGDLAKLQSTGFPIAKEGSHQVMGVPINFKAERGNNAGEMILSADKPSYTDHGMVFAFWNPIYGEAPKSIDDWFHRSCNGHALTIKNLKPGTSYPFAAAYKGADSDDLVWSAVVTKMAAD